MPLAPFYTTYHEMAPEDSGYLYQARTARFEEHLGLAVGISKGTIESRYVPVVTFDDGHISNYELGFPLLQKHGVKAIFFVTAGWTSSRNGYMTRQHLRELADAGHEVQSHGLTHLLLTTADDGQLEEELALSKKLLEEAAGRAVNAISMPGGRWNQRVLRACVKAGYSRLFTSDVWSEPFAFEGAQVMGRMMVRRTTTAEELLRTMNLSKTQRTMRRSRYAAKELVKRALGDSIYQKLWRRLAKHDEMGGPVA